MQQKPWEMTWGGPQGMQVKPADPMRPGQITIQDQNITGNAYDNQLKGAKVPYAGSDARLDNEGKSLSNAKSAQELKLDSFKAQSQLKQSFDADPRVKTYRDALPQVFAAIGAPDNAQGDLAVIYAFGKTMDPGSAVREGELDLAQGTSSLGGKLQSYLGMVNSGKRLPPDVRRGLIETMRTKAHAFNEAYSQARQEYGQQAQAGGFDPKLIIGNHDGDKYSDQEKAWNDRWHTVSDQEIRKFLIDNQNMNEGQLQEYAKLKLGRTIDNLPEVMDGLKRTGHLSNIVNRTEAGGAELNGLLKGGLHVFDRAARGLEQGVNAITGSNFHSAADAMNARDAYFADKPVDNTADAVGRGIAAGVATAPFGGPVMQGALSGALAGDGTGMGLARDALIGGLTGKVADVALKGGAQLLAPQVDGPVQRLLADNVQLPPGRLVPALRTVEDLGTDLPFAGPRIRAANDAATASMNRAAGNRALRPIKKKLPANISAGHEMVDYTQGQLNDAYRDALAGQSISIDPTFATRLNAIGQRSTLPPENFNEVANLLQRDIGGAFQTGPTLGQMSGRTYKQLDERLGDVASTWGRSDDPFKRQQGALLREVMDQTRALARRQSPAMADALRSADEGWANFVPLRGAAAMSPTDGIFTPGQLRTAVRQADRTVGKGATARGQATLQDLASDASKVMPSDYGNSGTSPREAASMFRPYAMLKGAALSPLYSEPAIKALNYAINRQPSAAAQLMARIMNAAPGGALGAFGPLAINSGQ